MRGPGRGPCPRSPAPRRPQPRTPSWGPLGKEVGQRGRGAPKAPGGAARARASAPVRGPPGWASSPRPAVSPTAACRRGPRPTLTLQAVGARPQHPQQHLPPAEGPHGEAERRPGPPPGPTAIRRTATRVALPAERRPGRDGSGARARPRAAILAAGSRCGRHFGSGRPASGFGLWPALWDNGLFSARQIRSF